MIDGPWEEYRGRSYHPQMREIESAWPRCAECRINIAAHTEQRAELA